MITTHPTASSHHIEFRRLPEADPTAIIELMNHPRVRRQMPLTKDNFDEDDCATFVAGKEQLWREHGYGPWAFYVDRQFAGWGGLQPENGEPDLALVLHPDYWGLGKVLYDAIVARAFGEMGFATITVLFPSTRTRIKGLLRLGFYEDGTVDIGDESFIRYRLDKKSRSG